MLLFVAMLTRKKGKLQVPDMKRSLIARMVGSQVDEGGVVYPDLGGEGLGDTEVIIGVQNSKQ